jgi:ribosomal protein L34
MVFLKSKSLMQPTYSPSKLKMIRQCGFMALDKTRGDPTVLAAHRRQGHYKLSE